MLRRRLMQFKDIVLFHFDKPFDGVYKDEYNNAICTCNNYTPTISTSIKKFGAGSFYHDNGATITVDTKLDYQDFTVEAWVYPTTRSSNYNWRQMFKVSGSGMMIAIANATAVSSYAYWLPTNTSGQNRYISLNDFKLNEWNHVAIVYNNSTVKAKIYINGIQIGNEESITWKSRPTNITIDIGGTGSLAYIDEFIFSKGIKYDGNFTPEDPYKGHAYVEIGGIKWATMNIGANSITDTGLYFQWGDTKGYTAEQVDSGTGKKYFGWTDYKYGNGTSSPGATGMTKYNSTDGKTVLDLSDDAARDNWGGQWRMPTAAEFQALSTATIFAWVSNYQGSGVAGLECIDKTDSSKTLFFPAAGCCDYGSVDDVGSDGYYWSSSRGSSSVQYAYYLDFYSGNVGWDDLFNRFYGLPVRAVIG